MKARNPGNTVAATNPVFDLLMTLDLLQPLLLIKDFILLFISIPWLVDCIWLELVLESSCSSLLS